MRMDVFWSQIQTLSQLDQKSVSQCVLKVFEEGGELAAAAQPFDGLDGSHHRLSTRRDVLEECIDGILANLSIACKLGFEQDEVDDMLSQKIAKWATKQRAQAVMQQAIPYEIHVTVQHADLDSFTDTCMHLQVKPIVLALQHQQGDLQDVMTSSVIMGNNQTALSEMNRISDGLAQAGFTVVRKKIETVPWHPAAPSEEYHQYTMPTDCYFESHIAVLVPDEDTKSQLVSVCTARSLHLSRNAMKTYADGSYRQMLTYRAYSGTREAFLATLQEHITALRRIATSQGGLDIDKVITEFSLYDSRVHHDQHWLSGTDTTTSEQD